MVNFVLKELKKLFVHFGLYIVVRAVQYRILQNNYHFYATLERYNPETCTFFTSVGGMGFALHMVMGDIHYEQYITGTKELHLMKNDAPLVYETYWEVLYHFHIYAHLT